MAREDKKTKVVVAMSGGVDSSVAAALLKKEGYDVAGVFMRFWTEDKGCASGSEQAARAVAEKLKIPFRILDVRREFKKEVVDYFLSEQRRSRTPNPCVVCNKKIKFGVFLKKALEMKIDYIATGHYARIIHEIAYKIFAANDENKDQSYFLHQLGQRQLSKVIFPLGEHTKEEVKKMAKQWRLPCQQEQSFDLCFIKGEPAGFIKKYLKLKAGKIVKYQNKTVIPAKAGIQTQKKSGFLVTCPPCFARRGGREPGMTNKGKTMAINDYILGQHDGLPLYTIGQRKNIPVGQGPWWVVEKDERQNILYISNNEKDLYSRELTVEKVNWLAGIAPRLPIKALVKIRYKSEAGEATLRRIRPAHRGQAQGENQLKLIFIKPQRAITPGQSAVFYGEKGELLGGGVIK